MKNHELKKLFLLFVLWRAGLLLVTIIGQKLLPYQPSFPYASELTNYGLPHFISAWANFDGVHYLTIINKGYFGTGLIQAFFPLFPLLTTAINFFVQNSLVSGLFLSNIFSFLVVISLYQIGKIFSPKHVWLNLLVALSFPTSFFFGAFYSESLFFVLVLQSYLAAHNKKWWQAAMLAGFASATRIVGIFAIIMVITQFLFDQKTIWQLNKKSLRSTKQKLFSNWSKLIGLALLGSSGLIAYMTYLHLRYQDAWYFLHVQAEFGGGRQENLILYPQVVWRYIKILLTARPFDLKYFAYVQEAAVGFLGPILLFLVSKKTSLGALLFCLGAFFVPTLTGTFSSLTRYMLVLWPIYLALADLVGTSRWRYLYYAISLALLAFNTILFIQGYWVA